MALARVLKMGDNYLWALRAGTAFTLPLTIHDKGLVERGGILFRSDRCALAELDFGWNYGEEIPIEIGDARLEQLAEKVTETGLAAVIATGEFITEAEGRHRNWLLL